MNVAWTAELLPLLPEPTDTLETNAEPSGGGGGGWQRQQRRGRRRRWRWRGRTQAAAGVRRGLLLAIELQNWLAREFAAGRSRIGHARWATEPIMSQPEHSLSRLVRDLSNGISPPYHLYPERVKNMEPPPKFHILGHKLAPMRSWLRLWVLP